MTEDDTMKRLWSGDQYNQFVIHEDPDDGMGEKHVAEVTDQGVYIKHNWMDGAQFIPHEKWEELEEFRQGFLEEINRNDGGA